jgi:AraC-like DNA-binding protein
VGASVAAKRGIAAEVLLHPLGATLEQLAEPDAHVPVHWVAHVWNRAAELTGDPAFGLHAAEIANTQRGNVLDYVAEVCATARGIFASVMRHQRLLVSSSSLRLVERGRVARFEAPGRPDTRPLFVDDFVLAQVVLRVRRRSPSGFPLRAVEFEHEAPRSHEARMEYSRIFGAPVRFGAVHDALEFDTSLLDEPLANSDPLLAGMLLQHADAQLCTRDDTVETSVNAALRRHIVSTGFVTPLSTHAIARTLGLSERSMQRRLHEEGTSFKEVVDDVKRQWALERLADPRQSVSDVAFVLGFAEVSAFSRAFRRWTSKSPAQWRQDLRSPSNESIGVRGQHSGGG